MSDKKMSRRQAMKQIGTIAAATASVQVLADETDGQKVKVFKIVPLSGNNPIVAAPIDLVISSSTGYSVTIENAGTAGGVFDIKLAKLSSSGVLIYSSLSGFHTGQTSALNVGIGAGGKVKIIFPVDRGAPAFKPYSVLVTVWETTTLRTYGSTIVRP